MSIDKLSVTVYSIEIGILYIRKGNFTVKTCGILIEWPIKNLWVVNIYFGRQVSVLHSHLVVGGVHNFFYL